MSFLKKSVMPATLLLALGTTAPAVTAGATITVPGDFASIGAALTAALPGDTIVISKRDASQGGPYTNPVTIAKNDITFRGINAELDPRGSGTALTIKGDRVTVSGFTIRNATPFGIAVTGDDVTIRDTVVTACFGTGISIFADGATVYRCTIRHCTGTGIEYGANGTSGSAMISRNIVELNTGSGMLLSGDRLTVFANNLVNNTSDGIVILNGGYVASDPSTINYNYVASNNRNGILVVDPGLGPMTMFGNTLYQNGRNGIELSLGTGVKIQRNWLRSNSLSGIVIQSTVRAELIGNNVRSNGRHGIEVVNSGNGDHLIARNYCFYNGRDGFNVLGSNNRMLDNFSFSNLGDGVDLEGSGPTLNNDVSNNWIFRNAHEGIDNSGVTTRMVLNHVLVNGTSAAGPDIAGAGNGGIGSLGTFSKNTTSDDTSDPAVAAVTLQLVDIN